MPSVEELLNQDSEDEYINISPINDIITIDPETRTINLPASETLFGTEQEMNVERKYFKCPKIVGDNIDLSKHQIYITYVTAKDNTGTFLPEEELGLYYCEDMAVDGDYITFSWLLSGNVLRNHGFIAFAVSAKHMDGEVLKTRWKTKPAVGTVLLTVPDGEAIEERYPDIVTQLLDRMDAVEEIATVEAMQGYVDDYLGRNPVQIDDTLTDNTKAAPAGVVGELRGDLDTLNQGGLNLKEDFIGTQVNNWLDEHPEATTTVQDGSLTYKKLLPGTLGFVSFKMFGAVGDGVTNDYQAIKDCCAFAETNKKSIKNTDGTYYINGDTINLNASMYNTDNVTFVLGERYIGYTSLFEFTHDNVRDVKNVKLSEVFASRYKLQDAYSQKSFLLDTKIKYGMRTDGSDNDSTIVEPFYSTHAYTQIWYGSYEPDRIVDILQIADSGEKGYSFIGGNVKQKNTNEKGISFLKVARNNCIVRNINILCESNGRENGVIIVANGNNVIIDNIYCGSKVTNRTWGYDITLNNVAVVKTSNITEAYNGNAFGNRTVKDWSLENSNIGAWDVHWNAFGIFTVKNCNISGTIQIGYGNGILNITDSIALWLETRDDFMQIWHGQIITDNSYLTDGIHIKPEYHEDSTRSEWFDNFHLPDIIVRNAKHKPTYSNDDLYISIPEQVAELCANKGKIIFDNIDFTRGVFYAQSGSVTKKLYIIYIRDCTNLTQSMKDTFDTLGDLFICAYQKKEVATINNYNTGAFSSFIGEVTKINNIVTIKAQGTLKTDVFSDMTIWDDLPSDYIPNGEIRINGLISYDNGFSAIEIAPYNGKSFFMGEIPSNTNICISATYAV